MSASIIPRHQRSTGLKDFRFGAAYYPEHWSEHDRIDDLDRMLAAGINVIRMGEFAWRYLEPRPGTFDFTLFDETINLFGKNGIRTLFCTPTAAPPRWLTAGRDEWLRIDENGNRMCHGSRQHCCTNNKEFRVACRGITAALAEHYAKNPYIEGWQIDNEFFCHFSRCYCPSCVTSFRHWLAMRYGDIETLNQAWGNVFWGLDYDGFNQISLPYSKGRPAAPNPTHELDYCRFLSDAIIEFQKEQVTLLRSANPEWFVTHNGLFDLIDYWKFSEDLDFLSVDQYQGFSVNAADDSVWSAINCEKCRSATGSYLVMEQQAGAGGQKSYAHPTPAPGQMRLWTYQAVAHGADGVLHFRWRTCRFGAEQYWNGIIDHDNIPRRRFEEAVREGNELKRIGRHIVGTVLDAQVGVLVDTEQDNAHDTMEMGFSSPRDQSDLAFRDIWWRHLPCGFIQVSDRFDRAKCLIYPSMPIMDEALAEKLNTFVVAGGVLLVTARSAIRNRNNHVHAQTPPGYLSDLCGITVEESGRIEDGSLSISLDGTNLPSGNRYEILSPKSADVVGCWNPREDGSPASAAGRPAVTMHRWGKGCAVYVGTYLTDENVTAIMDLVIKQVDIAPLAECERAVELACRKAEGRRLVFVLNHYGVSRNICDLPTGLDLLTGQECRGALTLAPYDVAIIEEGEDRGRLGSDI